MRSRVQTTADETPSASRRRRDRLAWALVASMLGFLGFLLVACRPGGKKAPPTWPAGTVLALDGAPITADEVDAFGSMIARTEPEFVLTHLRRIALTNYVFQHKIALELGGGHYAEAHTVATELVRTLRAGEEPDPKRKDIFHAELEGNFKEIGLEAWNWAVDQPLGTWSDPIEVAGAFEVVRVESRNAAPTARSVVMKVSLWMVPFMSPENPDKAIESALDRAKIEYVDESWRDYVPESWKHRLRGGTL
jgi:hypothetical protein